MAIDNRFGGNMEQSNSGIRSLRRSPNVAVTEDTFQPINPPGEFNSFGRSNPRQPGIGIQNNSAPQEESGFEKFNDYVRRGINPMQNAGRGLMDLLGSGYNKLDEILDFKGMKEQIPYVLDNFIPGYEPTEGYYDDDYDGEPMEEYPQYDPNNPNHFMTPEGMDPELFMPGVETLEAGMGMNPYDVADLDDDNIAAQILASQGYGNEDIISMLSSRSI